MLLERDDLMVLTVELLHTSHFGEGVHRPGPEVDLIIVKGEVCHTAQP